MLTGQEETNAMSAMHLSMPKLRRELVSFIFCVLAIIFHVSIISSYEILYRNRRRFYGKGYGGGVQGTQ